MTDTTKPANKLRAAVMSVQGRMPPANPVIAPSEPVSNALPRTKPQSRVGKRCVQAFVSTEAYRQLHLLALDLDSSIQDLAVEALNDLFRKHNKSAVA